jgi:hypothetical protein
MAKQMAKFCQPQLFHFPLTASPDQRKTSFFACFQTTAASRVSRLSFPQSIPGYSSPHPIFVLLFRST